MKYIEEMSLTAEAVQSAFEGEKMNYELLITAAALIFTGISFQEERGHAYEEPSVMTSQRKNMGRKIPP